MAIFKYAVQIIYIMKIDYTKAPEIIHQEELDSFEEFPTIPIPEDEAREKGLLN